MYILCGVMKGLVLISLHVSVMVSKLRVNMNLDKVFTISIAPWQFFSSGTEQSHIPNP
jgi:hypothetical protein